MRPPMESFVHQLFNHAIEDLLVSVPVGHFTVENPEEFWAMVVVDQVGEFMDDHVVHTRPRCLYQVRVQDDLARWGTRSNRPA